MARLITPTIINGPTTDINVIQSFRKNVFSVAGDIWLGFYNSFNIIPSDAARNTILAVQYPKIIEPNIIINAVMLIIN